MPVPATRLRALNDRPEVPGRAFVLYWMVAARRTRWNPALQHALDLAQRLRKPLVVLEALRAGYPWASDRIHRFVLDGMADNEARLRAAGVASHPYVEASPGAGAGLLAALAGRACAVVTDEFPAFFVPRMQAAAAGRLDVRLVAVDGNGLLPLSATAAESATAYAFRRLLQRELPGHLRWRPAADPLRAARTLPPAPSLPRALLRRWPAADPALLAGERGLTALPIDHGVPPAPQRGGERAARARLRAFLDRDLPRYATERSDPDADVTSRLSPYLHFGHLSVHEVLSALARREDWSAERLSPAAHGRRSGFWGMSEAAEAFLDQLVTWRELGFHFCRHRPRDHDAFSSLPAWAAATLEQHAGDPRPHLYDLDAFEAAATHDPLWNAAQRQLLREGRLHNHLRMLWGKKILHWSASPQEALAIMLALNDRHALDGRDPNSSTGILWCLGRHDRPWPERPVFGTVRAMSSRNTARKVRVADYLQRYGERADAAGER